MTVEPGSLVGGYRIERVLGAGGMGTVYLGAHPTLPRFDALKVLQPEASADPEFRARFIREANIVAALTHPNIVSVYDRGEDHGRLWIAMRYVEGTDAAALMEREPLAMTPQRAVHIISEIGKGLDYAHQQGLLHRDVKPANFLLSSRDWHQILLSDFGIAKSAAADATELTRTGSVLATLSYASPEQLHGRGVDHRTDIYSLGCSLYKLLTGQNPYPATEAAQVMHAHLYAPPPRITALCPHLPPALDEVLVTAMAKHPADRFDSCHEFSAAVMNALSGAPASMPQTSNSAAANAVTQRVDMKATPNPPRRRSAIAITAVVAAVAAVVAATGVALSNSDSSNPEPAAKDKSDRPTAAISVGFAEDGPMAIDPSTQTLYLAKPLSNAVTVIDMTKNRVSATIPVGENPRGLALDPANRTLFVVNSGTGLSSESNNASTVSIIDTSTNQVTGTVPTGMSSWSVAVDTKTRLAYVLNLTDPAIAPRDMSSSLSVIDPASKTVVATIPQTGFQAEDVAMDSNTGTAYVTSFSDGRLKVIDTMSRKVVSSIQLEGMPGRIALDSSSHTAYVTAGSGLSVIDTKTNSMVARIPADCTLHGIAVDPGRAVYAGCEIDSTVYVIDPVSRTVREILKAPTDTGIAVDASAHTLFVYGQSAVRVFER